MIHYLLLLLVLWIVLRLLIWLFVHVAEMASNLTSSGTVGIFAGLVAVALVSIVICWGFGFSIVLLIAGITGVILLGSFRLLIMPGAAFVAAAIGLLLWLMLG